MEPELLLLLEAHLTATEILTAPPMDAPEIIGVSRAPAGGLAKVG